MKKEEEEEEEKKDEEETDKETLKLKARIPVASIFPAKTERVRAKNSTGDQSGYSNTLMVYSVSNA